MARDEDDDLYEEEFDFVDDEEDEVEEASDVDEDDRDDPEVDELAGEEEGEEVDEYGRGKPAADYVVHIYEHQKLKRTIDRPFTAEDAEAFASEYNRSSKSYGRFAVAGKNDAKPKKTLD